MRRIRQHVFTVVMLFLTGGMLACGGPWRDGYFKKGVDRLTQDEVTEKFGSPHTAKTPVLGGDSVWTYRVPLAEKELSSLHFAGVKRIMGSRHTFFTFPLLQDLLFVEDQGIAVET